jgi:hypothetical protein
MVWCDISFGHAVVVEALCYKPEGRGFEIRWRRDGLGFHVIHTTFH